MVNQRSLDTEFCGRVPLHQTNLIQPHGILLIVDKESLQIVQVSENVTELFGKPAPEVVTTSLTDYLSAEQVRQLQERFSTKQVQGKIPFSFAWSAGDKKEEHLALIQTHERYLLVEIERSDVKEADNSFINIYQELKYIISAIEHTQTVTDLSAVIVTELKRISGFDKVMVYQFDENWNGTVIGEAKEEEMDSYMGLKFPASDIPKQAREMYRKNPYRVIPNAYYEPVRLYPVLNPVTHSFTDLMDSNLRSVAGVHIEYLKNMQVTASMSTRILSNNTLWGLISCHHRTPKYLSYQMCSLFELLSDIVSAKIAALQNRELMAVTAEKHNLLSQLIEAVYRSQGLQKGLQQQYETLLKLLQADGLAVVINKQIDKIGITPAQDEIEDLIFWLQVNGITQTYHQPGLPTVYENAIHYSATASGLLALPIQPEKGAYILAFRPEAVQKVAWGGNPNEAITFEPDGKTYHPRNSFKIWQETVQYNAVPWQHQDIEIAEKFRNFVVEFTLSKM